MRARREMISFLIEGWEVHGGATSARPVAPSIEREGRKGKQGASESRPVEVSARGRLRRALLGLAGRRHVFPRPAAAADAPASASSGRWARGRSMSAIILPRDHRRCVP